MLALNKVPLLGEVHRFDCRNIPSSDAVDRPESISIAQVVEKDSNKSKVKNVFLLKHGKNIY